ncbi:DNA topoisomerase I [Candidatus Nitrosocosmicus arcticus]|uniref:DNA topoisomerase n=1 Tax=Candidatus Nitrosocosmicus arcticus TaxID=2035267 RepID=A0A557SUR4_9ARCH|nr:DNA topoisomerase I [Candidatus Nitrosocosmicus arcticus]TVP40354.1 DNA topoisomerase IA [Candidatus Nitrosocosmicus arcticus]
MVVICEKPSVAKRIAQALSTHHQNNNYSDKPLDQEQKDQSPASPASSTSFTTIKGMNGQNYIICHALGHLYGLSDSKKGNTKVFPVLDPTWLPLSILKSKGSASKFLSYKIDKILREISEISKNAAGFIHACDYDQEGEVIGYNILEHTCHNKYSISKRAKFSSLTDEEIIQSFNNLLPPNEKLKDAGVSRHMIDFIYGINLSRALTNSIKKESSREKKGYRQLSIGRVQGPTLAFVIEREAEIENHIFEPYWNVRADFLKNNQTIRTQYYPQRIDSKSTAENIINACKNQLGKVTDINIQKTSIKPPIPFSLGDLQKEAYRLFRFTPSYTLSIAEKLYLGALISYPRTSSQKLPSSINYEKIIKAVSKLVDNNLHHNSSYGNKTKSILSYSNISSKLLSNKVLKPNEGKETDPAHPAIYPTGEKPKRNLEDSEIKLLDLIIRRFFSSFGEEATSSQISVTITVKDKFTFKAEEKKIVFEGWIEYYRPYFDVSGFVILDSLSFLKRSDILRNVKIELLEKFTQPPPRYNQSTLLQKMEKEKIGTKATRSEIISTLFKRNYIDNYVPSASNQSVTYNSKIVSKSSPNSSIQKEQINKDEFSGIQRSGLRPTEIGIAIVSSMKKYIPNIVSTSLTRDMEAQLEQVESGNTTSVQVVDKARNQIKEAIQSFNLNESKIGQEISLALEANRTTSPRPTSTAVVTLGTCPVCKSGKLTVKKAIKSKKRFAGCTNYSSAKCLATSSLPQKGIIKSTGKKCEKCSWPIISASGNNQGRRYQWEFCINSQCPLKLSSSNINNQDNSSKQI